MSPDIYYKKTLTYKYGHRQLQFRVSQDLFSSFQVDIGTQFLIRTMTLGHPFPFRKILDLGCGYGPIGITLQSLHPDAAVHMVDKDALAVDYTRQNVALNNLSNATVFGSLGYENLTVHDYDLIVSNIPAKAGEPVIKHWLEDAVDYLAPGGSVAVVVVKTLETAVRAILTGNPDIEIVRENTRPGHIVFQYRFNQHPQHPLQGTNDIYSRGIQDFTGEDVSYRLEEAYGLETYGDLPYATTLLLGEITGLSRKKIHHCLVYNPGAGHLPVVLSKLLSPFDITLTDRDLLGLKYAQRNLILNGYPAGNIRLTHQVGFAAGEDKMDFIAGFLREEEGPAAVTFTVRQIAAALNNNGLMILAGSSTGITRVADSLPDDVRLKELNRQKYRGFSVITLLRI